MNSKVWLNYFLVMAAVGGACAVSGCRVEPPAEAPPGGSQPVHYACPAHPLIVSGEQGSCSQCGIALEAQKSIGAYICVDHFESAGVSPGACDSCGKLLVNIPSQSMWKCTRHPEVLLDGGDACPVCDSKLVEVMVGKVWVCTRSLEEALGKEGASGLTALRLQGNGLGFTTEEIGFEDGECGGCGRALLEVTVQVPHGDHNPRHGGVLRMASDQWHHIEAVVPREGFLRLYFFDNYTRPLDASGFSAKYLRATFDEKDGFTDGVESFAMEAVKGASCLEAEVANFSLPLHVVVKVMLGGKDERFDFTIRSLGSAGSDPGNIQPTRPGDELIIPATAVEIVAALGSRDDRVQGLMSEQDYKRLFVPAFEAKALALSLEKKMATTEADARLLRLRRAVKEVVRGAWLLDHFGDQGDRNEVQRQYRVFAGGVRELKALYPAGSSGK